MKAAVYFCDLNTIINANAPDIKTLITREPQSGSGLNISGQKKERGKMNSLSRYVTDRLTTPLTESARGGKNAELNQSRCVLEQSEPFANRVTRKPKTFTFCSNCRIHRSAELTDIDVIHKEFHSWIRAVHENVLKVGTTDCISNCTLLKLI